MIAICTGEVTLPDKRSLLEAKIETYIELGYTIVGTTSNRDGGRIYITVILQKLTDR